MGSRGPLPKQKLEVLVDYVAGVPAAPQIVRDDAEALMEWDRITDIMLESEESIRLTDMATLAVYCLSWADYNRYRELVKLEGETLTNKEGSCYPNPNMNFAITARKALLESASKLGFNPMDRCRITKPKSAEKKNDNPIITLLKKNGPSKQLRA